uniref:Uncharacterized protein n=1 Tax=Avena sativa TaxID=4498 RepID=A0ACD5WMB4_AVESA
MGTPRSHKRPRQHEPTTLMSLGDDMLAEILRRLPSLPSLARAAFACPRLGNVAFSSVTNRIISPAPLLGYFISVVDGDIPSFHRALLRANSDVAAIVRCGDFHLAGLEDYEWRLMDCRHGLLLLTSDRSMAVFDPVSSSRLHIPYCMNMGNGGGKSSFHCFLPACGDATSFRVLCLQSTGGGRVRPHVYNSCTGEWFSHSLASKGIRPPRRGDQHMFQHYMPMLAGERIYWRTTNAEMFTSLDVGSMEFSHVPIPDKLGRYSSYALGDTDDGTTCIVDVSTRTSYRLYIRVWFLVGSSWGQEWRVDASHLLADDCISVAKVCNVTAGIVLLSTGYKHKALRYIAFSLKDALREGITKLANFFTSAGWVQPYFMAWPRPRLKAAGSTENASICESEQEAAAGSNSKKQV